MRQSPIYRIPCLFFVALAASWSMASHAFVVSIDDFSVVRNGALFFDDSFTDGIPPPSGPAGPSTYNVFGTIPGTAESGGKLLLDSANGALSANAIEQARRVVNATLRSDTSGDLSLGLKSDDTLSLTGIFSLTTPSGVLNPQYAIRFTDNSGAGAHQILQLQVRFNTAAGQTQIRYILQDFDLNTITELGAALLVPPPSGADEIRLNINRPTAVTANDGFFGSFAYLTGGVVVGSVTTFAQSGQMFQGENFVRADFNISDAFVPEPGTAWLIGLAVLFMLAGMRRARG